MADITIRFRHNRRTGKRELVISYESEEDRLQHEHERDHRAVVEKLLGMPLPDDVGEIRVERGEHRPAEGEAERDEAQRAKGTTKEPG